MIRELNLFLSYRREDSYEFSNWLYNKIQGRSFHIASNPYIAVIKIDQTFPGGIDWKKHIVQELIKAKRLIVICSPSIINKSKNDEDWFYYEIEWWIENRKNTPPILIASGEHNKTHVPYAILNQWKNLQVISIDFEKVKQNEESQAESIHIFVENIFRSINNLKSTNTATTSIIQTSFVNERSGIYAWAKDRYHRYIYANEAYAKAAGFDSPKAMYRKTDLVMPWRSLAKFFQEGDSEIMFNNELKRITVYEKEIMSDKVVDIIVNEVPLKDSSGKVIGVSGCFFEVTEVRKYKLEFTEDGVFLGKEFDNIHFNNIEIQIFKRLIKNMDKRKIALELNLKINQVKGIIKSLQNKLQCSNESDIIITAVRKGLPIKLFS